jgi:drug/metabolite transporter (DMT)-like permease
VTAPRPREAAVFVVIASLAFATSGPLARWARPLDPLLVAFVRCALAALALFALEPRGVIASARALSSRQGLAVLGAGALLGAHFALFLVGLDRTSLPAAVSLVSLEPLAVVLTAWAIFGVRPSRLEAAGVLLAMVGALVVARGAGTGEHRLEGDLLVLAAVGLFGFYVAAARLLRESMPPRHYAALVYGGAALSLALVLPILEAAPGTTRWPIPAHAWVAVVALALVPTLIGHTAVQTAARRLPPAIVSLASPGETVGGVAIGAVALGAVPGGHEIAGALAIVAGATVALLGARRATRGRPPLAPE